ncbi:unnamed protein product [Sphagnum balticum]
MAMAVLSVRAAMPVSSTRAAAAAHTEFYDLLRVDKKASSSQLKTAYRKLALEHHPDVSQHPDANRRFAQLSNAYEVLIDPELRAVYDVSGEKGLRGRESKNRGAAWAVWESWDEFKPFQRKTRKGDARSIAAARSGVQGLSNEEGGEVTEAQSGDVVEYPLSVVVKAQHQDGRNKGVGLVVSRNKDRQDRHKLSPENLELVEIEPLFKEPESQAWRPDPMEGAAFSSLHDLRVLHAEYDRISDMWMILDELSHDCDSPVYAEEVIL